MLQLKPKEQSRYDMVSLGEVMLRLEPFPRGTTASDAISFIPWIGGGETNPILNAAILGYRTAAVTAFPDHDLARLAMAKMRQAGVDLSYVKVLPYDGLGQEHRLGLNFTTPGDGVRPNKVIYDRANATAGKLKQGDIPWTEIFSKGVRVFHTGGIYAGVSENAPLVMEEAMQAASQAGTCVTYDLNLRKKQWKNLAQAVEVNKRLVSNYVTAIFGNEAEFKSALGVEAKLPEDVDKLDINDTRSFEIFAPALMHQYSNVQLVGRSMRNEKTSTLIDWGGMICVRNASGGFDFYKATPRFNLQLVERTGGGDSFYLGVMIGFMNGLFPQEAVEYGAALAAIKMSNAGDILTLSAKLEDIVKEIEAAKKQGARRTDR
jgi:2-dehydro-3-deoxygluconokinase